MIDSDDDALCLKSTLERACKNVTVSNCVLSSHANAIKMGTESNGGFQNITITNCTICSPRYSQVTYGCQRGLAGIALEIVDGGDLDGVVLSNIAMRGVTVPIFIRLGNRARPFKPGMPKPEVGRFRNVSLNNIVATGVSNVGCSITGLPQHPVENVTFRDIRIEFEGGGSRAEAGKQVPEKADSYPESTMFGVLPAYGFYCRHARGLKFCDWSSESRRLLWRSLTRPWCNMRTSQAPSGELSPRSFLDCRWICASGSRPWGRSAWWR